MCVAVGHGTEEDVAGGNSASPGGVRGAHILTLKLWRHVNVFHFASAGRRYGGVGGRRVWDG